MIQEVNEQATPPDAGARALPATGMLPAHVNFRRLIIRGSVFRVVSEYVGLVVSVLVALVWAYGWKAGDSLSKPLAILNGDGLIALFVAKALGEGHLLENGRLGAPFGLAYYDFHQPDFVHEGLMKLLVAVTGDPMLALNLFYVSGFFMIAIAAYFVLRHLSISGLVAGGSAVLYAFLPYHLLRSFYHLFLSSYWIAPLTSLLALKIMAGAEDVPIPQAGPANTEPDSVADLDRKRPWSILWWALPLCVVIGGSGVYYSFFSLLFLAVAGAYALFAHKAKHYVAVAALCSIVIVASTVAGMLPAWRYNAANGPNPNVAARSAYESEVYGLKIAQLLLPMPEHRIAVLKELTARYESAAPALDENESRFAALGFAGTAGFLILLMSVVWRFRRPLPLLHHLGLLNLAGLLFATTSGFGAIFSLLIASQLRAQNRISVFLGFFALAALAVCLEKLRRVAMVVEFSIADFSWRRSLPRLVVSTAVLLLVMLGLYDQVPAQLSGPRSAAANDFDNRRAFIGEIEQRLPKGAEVLELPYESFPEGPPLNKMENYDHLRGYVFSSDLKWSFPAMRGREGDEWIRDLSLEPGQEMVPDAVALGFRGIYIDRWGYQDQGAGMEAQLQSLIGKPALTTSDGRLAFYSLNHAPALVSPRAEGRLFPVSFVSGFYGRETSPGREWRWCDKEGRVVILNPEGHVRKVRLTIQAFTASANPAHLSIRTPTGDTREFQFGAAGTMLSLDLILNSGLNRFLLSTDAPRLQTGSGDPRALYFRVEHFEVTPE